MHCVIANGVNMRNLPKHFLCNRRCCDIISDKDALSGVSLMKGRLELKEIRMVGD